jgi:mRNA interferase MazF
MLALNERQENLLMTLKQTIEDESNKNNIDGKVNEVKSSNEVINFRTNDKSIHSNIDNKDVIMDRINYNSQRVNLENIDMKDIKRGDILWINLFGSAGSEQASDSCGRPCICIQNNIGNAYSPTIIVACITSQMTKAKLPIHVEISSSEEYGLDKDSVVLLEQLRTIDKKKRILRKSGRVDQSMMTKIDKALLVSVFESPEKTELEKLPKYIRVKMEEMLDDINIYEKALSKAKSESLIKNLLEQREAFLGSLQIFCENNKLNYRDYYKMYEKKEEKIAM